MLMKYPKNTLARAVLGYNMHIKDSLFHVHDFIVKPQICSFDIVVMQARISAKMGAALAALFISSLTDRIKTSVDIVATNCSVFLLWNFISVWIKFTLK